MSDFQSIKSLLDRQAALINSPAFIDDDPVQFPRLFTDPRDIEIASLLVSSIAWGRRTMICRNASRMLALMDLQPYLYVMDEGYRELPDGNIHRTFFASDMRHYLRGLKLLYSRHGSLQGLAKACGATESPLPAWTLAEAINKVLAEANDGCGNSRCLPLQVDTSALKRLNMALRWLVRRDGIVDLGIWDALKPSQLFIPLDVHVGNVSRQLGLLTRRANDRKAAVELTETLRQFDPEDPVRYDFALFGIGVMGTDVN